MRRPVTVSALAALAAVTLVFGADGVARAQLAPALSAAPKPGAPAQKTESVTPLTPPVLRARVEATYPPAALRDRLEGTVGLEIAVDDTGHVTGARVTTPAGHGFDEAAIEAVRQFTFEPARKNGAAVRSIVQLGYEFHLPVPPAPPPAVPSAPVKTQEGPDQSTLVVAERLPPAPASPAERNSASDSTTDQRELSLRPRYRAEGVLETVPGLFSVQHAGGGKAQQDFMRGFDLDHGTDLAFFVDGAPINAVSHAHGQGYSDLHFLIPETIDRIDSTKGPYAADVGDFGTAGSVQFRMADHVDQSFAKGELGPDGHERAVIVESPDFGDRWRMVVAAEAFHEDGPFIHPEDFGRFNGYMKATRVLDDRSELSLMLMAYGGSWNMSGVLPARAVCGEGDGTPTPAAYAGSHCISRWDSLDPTQGGSSQRLMASTEYRRRFDGGWDLDASAFTLHSNMQLYPNDGIAASFQPDGIAFGSQIEQDDTRTESGTTVRLSHRSDFAGMPVRTTLGLQFRDDAIESQLHRTEGRQRLDGVDASIPGPIADSEINETELGAWVEGELRPTRWLRFVLGGRADRIDVAVNNESPTALDKVSGTQGAGQFSPKGTAVVSPIPEWDLFANTGRGFHSNDARTIVEGSATTLIATATGAEVGTTVRPVPGLSVSAVAFVLHLTSELVIDGDTAATTPSGETRRTGGEFTARYHFRQDLYADASFTAAQSRYTDAADVAAGTVYVPNAPVRTFSAGIGAREPVGPVTIIGSATVRSMSDRPADKGPTPLVETGFTVVNASAGVRWKNVEVVADVLNVFDTTWREGQFEVASRLPLEGPNPAPGISFTPGLPRTLLVRGSVYW